MTDSEKPLEEEVAELERELPKAEIRGASHIDFGRRINRLIDDWRARGERIEALRQDLNFYQIEAVARTGTNASMKPARAKKEPT